MEEIFGLGKETVKEMKIIFSNLLIWVGKGGIICYNIHKMCLFQGE